MMVLKGSEVMKTGFVSTLIKPMSVFIMLLLMSFNVNAARPKYVPDEILVKFKDGVSEKLKSNMRKSSALQRTEPMYRAQLLKQIKSISVERWKVDGGKSIEEIQQELMKDENVLYAEPNYYMYPHARPNDTYYSRQWGLKNIGQSIYGSGGVDAIGNDMDMESAWDIHTGSSSVVVAVVDDGVTSHVDLNDNMLVGWNILTDQAGAVPNLSSSPGSTHGTLVSGVVGAVGDNGIGITGTAWDVSIMPILFSSDAAETGTSVDAAIAFDYAREELVDIVNFSYGSLFYNQTLADSVTALESAGILLVTSAGNSEVNNSYVPMYPSSLPNKNIISVAASDQLDDVTSWSQYGSVSVDVVAPGENICTTRVNNGYTCSQTIESDSYIDGTSFSAPYVAGVAALIKSKFQTADYQDIKGRIMAGVEAQTTAQDKVASGGRVNANSALTALATPVLVVNSISVDASGNGVIDPNETVDLAIGLENIWSNSTSVSAMLSTSDSEVSIAIDTESFGNISKGGSAVATYSVTLGDVAGHRLIPFQLDITAAGGYTETRYFNIETGLLENNVTSSALIKTNKYDDIHYYHFSVPSGATSLTVSTSCVSDIDLFVQSGGAHPEVVLDNGGYYYGSEIGLEKATGYSGNETISVVNPTSGNYFVAVYNANSLSNVPYTIKMQLTVDDSDDSDDSGLLDDSESGGGGGSINLLLLLTLFSLGTALRIRKN